MVKHSHLRARWPGGRAGRRSLRCCRDPGAEVDDGFRIQPGDLAPDPNTSDRPGTYSDSAASVWTEGWLAVSPTGGDADTRKRRIEGLQYGTQYRSYATTPETSKRLSEALHRRWKDPDMRKQLSEAMRLAWANPEKRERLTETIRRAWKTPEMKKNQSEGLRRAWTRPEARRGQSVVS